MDTAWSTLVGNGFSQVRVLILYRQIWVFFHRYVGLAMSAFLIIVGLTGSLLAFYPELQRLANPHWYVDRAPSDWLSPGELAARSEDADPRLRVYRMELQSFEGVTRAWVGPRVDVSTGEPFELDFDYLVLDPATGAVLDRSRWGAIGDTWRQIVDFIYELHYSLALDMFGVWLLGFIALAWTIDCFIGAYLTFPANPGKGSFWTRWKQAWKIKRGASTYRFNFDLHRAGGLWLWFMLFIFAWSSVYMNLWDTVYTWTTRAVLDYRPAWVVQVPEPQPLEDAPLSWQEAQTIASQLMEQKAKDHGFRTGRAVMISYHPDSATYVYQIETSLDIDVRPRRFGAQVILDARTGEFKHLLLPRGQYAGNTVSNWLYALHMGNVFGLPYRIFVCVMGLLITMLSVTGIYIWWKKLKARRLSALRRHGSFDAEVR